MIYVVIATTKERRPRLEKCLASLRESTFPHAVVVYENNDGGCVLATKKAIEGINGLIWLLNDDMIVAPDALAILYKEYLREFPLQDGVCQPWEQIHKGHLGVAPFCHTNTIRPFLEHYIHNFWDTEFTITMTGRGKYRIVPEAKMIHEHFSQGMAEVDETYKRTQGKYAADEATFRQRLARGFK